MLFSIPLLLLPSLSQWCEMLSTRTASSRLLCTCFFVSTVVCSDFSLGHSCKEAASCRIMLRQPKKGRDASSPEFLGRCCGIAGNPQCPYKLLLPCCSRCFLLFFSSLHYYLPHWASGTRWAAPPGPIRLLEGTGCWGEGLGHWRSPGKQCCCPSRVAISASTLVIAYITSPPAQPRLPSCCLSPHPSSRQYHLSSPWAPKL